MEPLHIVKIGGSIVNSSDKMDSFLKEFISIDYPKILVHGGGRSASDLCKKLDIPIKMTEGRRITDKPALNVAVMVYAGLINKNIVARLQASSCNALGLSGADLNIIPAQKRSGTEIDFGYVGDIEAETINTHFLGRLLEEQIVAVISAITHDNEGQLLNTNADTIAATLAVALTGKYKVKLSYCFEKVGVLQQLDDDDSLMTQLSYEKYMKLKQDDIINEGMIPKLDTAFGALRQKVHQVEITHADNLTNRTGTSLSL